MNLRARALLDSELDELNQSVLALSSMVDKAIGDAVDSLMTNNVAQAEAIILGDSEINRLRFHIEERAYVILSTQQPLARDLRTVIAAIHFAVELERIGDHAAGIARIVTRIGEMGHPLASAIAGQAGDALEGEAAPAAGEARDEGKPAGRAAPPPEGSPVEGEPVEPPRRLKFSRLPKMTKRARDMLERAIEAYIERDVSKANAIVKRDHKIDNQYRKFFTEAMAEMQADHPGELPTYILWVAHNLERIGDRTTNLAERVIFMVTGQYTEVLEEYD
jgi:phosphate transport system protein